MKVRQGFVSNSSSSSFIFVGVLINCPTSPVPCTIQVNDPNAKAKLEEYNEAKRKFDEAPNNFEKLEKQCISSDLTGLEVDNMILTPINKIRVGKYFITWDSDYDSDKIFSVDELTECVNEVKESLRKIGIDDEVTICCGTSFG